MGSNEIFDLDSLILLWDGFKNRLMLSITMYEAEQVENGRKIEKLKNQLLPVLNALNYVKQELSKQNINDYESLANSAFNKDYIVRIQKEIDELREDNELIQNKIDQLQVLIDEKAFSKDLIIELAKEMGYYDVVIRKLLLYPIRKMQKERTITKIENYEIKEIKEQEINNDNPNNMEVYNILKYEFKEFMEKHKDLLDYCNKCEQQMNDGEKEAYKSAINETKNAFIKEVLNKDINIATMYDILLLNILKKDIEEYFSILDDDFKEEQNEIKIDSDIDNLKQDINNFTSLCIKIETDLKDRIISNNSNKRNTIDKNVYFLVDNDGNLLCTEDSNMALNAFDITSEQLEAKEQLRNLNSHMDTYGYRIFTKKVKGNTIVSYVTTNSNEFGRYGVLIICLKPITADNLYTLDKDISYILSHYNNEIQEQIAKINNQDQDYIKIQLEMREKVEKNDTSERGTR